jgi:peptide/nickel transport system permease protein
MIFLGVVIVCAIIGPWIAPHDPLGQDLTHPSVGPSWSNLFGTDDLGRDLLSRVMVGARPAIVGPVVIAVGAMVLGSIIGVAAGYLGGRFDSFVMRVIDLLLAVPGLLIAIVVVGVFGGGYWIAVGVLVALATPFDARLIRGVTLEQTNAAYVEAAKTLGYSRRTILGRHIWPNLLPTIVANSLIAFSYALVALASLSFLGLGVPPGEPEWGVMLSESRTVIFTSPGIALAPGLALLLTAVSANLVGEWLFERMSRRGTAA